MRILPFVTAGLVAAFLFLFVFERDRLTSAAGASTAETEAAASESADAADASAETEAAASGVPVVALRSTATQIDSAVLIRGRTEAARQVDVRAETSGQVLSEPLRKGAFVNKDQLLCELDPGTRDASLAEARARLAEAQARIPEAQARVEEALARLTEAQINDNAASKLSEGGFASETRVASTAAAVQAAKAGVSSAESGLQAAESGIQSAEAAVAAAGKEIERLQIHAPFEGLLESDTAELGSLLQPGALCATIIQLDPIKLVGFVPEVEVDRVTVGAQAGARLVSGRQIAGRVTFLSRSADMTTRTFRVEVTVPNADLSVRDGQTADILIAAEGTKAHLLPGSAMTLNDDGDLGVRVVVGGDTVQFVPVTMLRDTPEGVLLAGLDDTADIIVVGQEFVTDGVEVVPTYRDTSMEVSE